MNPMEAARLLYQNGHKIEAENILRHLWENTERSTPEFFNVLCALLEVGASKDLNSVHQLLDSMISGEGKFGDVWRCRTLAQQGVLFEWHGHISFLISEKSQAFDSLTRAASLGRDTSILWYQLAELFVENDELDLGLRYARRSIQLYKQLDLDFLKEQQDIFGAFGGHHPTGFSQTIDNYLSLLLKSTKLAKSQKSLKAVREIVVELIHQFPDDIRLPKIRLLIEKNVVSSAVHQRA